MKTTKIQDKTNLKKLLRHEGYDNIAIWADGRWSDVGSGYGGEQDGNNNPSTFIKRSNHYDLTAREILELIRAKEQEINLPTFSF